MIYRTYCYAVGGVLALLVMGIVAVQVIKLVTPDKAEAAMPVIDAASLSKMSTSINEMGKQVNLLEENTRQNRQMLDAIGEASTVSVPFFNGAKLVKRFRQNWGCLILGTDDLKRAMPGLDFKDVDLGSICGARDFYKKGLFIDPEQFKDMDNYQREKLVLLIKQRRENVASESVLRALGTATTAIEANKEYNNSIEEYKGAVDKATTQNERLASIASGQVLIAQGISQTNQLLTQLLKLQSSIYAGQTGIVNGSLGNETKSPDEKGSGS